MINILFYAGVVIISYGLAKLFYYAHAKFDIYNYRCELEESNLSDDNFFFKYQMYRDEIGKKGGEQ